jgi:hypothetical protein
VDRKKVAMKAAMVSTWTGNRPGREGLSLAYGREVDEFIGKFAADGKCTWPKWFFGTTGPSVWFVEGELEDLAMIAASPEARKLIAKGPLMNEGFTLELCGADRDVQFGMFEEMLAEMKTG